MTDLQRLAGERRRAIAEGLWHAWREDGSQASVLVGLSGIGKTERVVLPLVARARQFGVAVYIDVPARPTQLDQELLGRLVEALRESNELELAAALDVVPNFVDAVRSVLRNGGLVVLDEFQRLLPKSQSQPVEPYAEAFAAVARRPADGGCLWLVSNRMFDPVWSEPFHSAFLEAPTETADAIRIVVEALGTGDAADRLPELRHEEVAQRFGRNPRALRLLGQLLRSYALDELIGPPQPISEGLSQKELSDSIELILLAKAREGLSNSASVLLRDLSVLTEPAPMGMIQALGSHLGEVGPLLREMQDRFLLEQRNALRQVHPLVREVELPRLSRDIDAYRAVNLKAGAWHASRLDISITGRDDHASLARTLAGARYHLLAAASPNKLKQALDKIRPYLDRQFNLGTRMPSTAGERDAQIALLELYLLSPGPSHLEYRLARLLRARGEGDDLTRAVTHAKRATVGQDTPGPWVLWLKLAFVVEGPDAAMAIARKALEAVEPSKGILQVYQNYAAILASRGRDDEALALCLEGAHVTLGSGREGRLIEEASAFAAAMPTNAELVRVRDWAAAQEGLEVNVALADILLNERAGDWLGGAERARIARRRHPKYIHSALHEAFCWLGANEPEKAQFALDEFPIPWRFEARDSVTWLAAFVAMRYGDVARGRDLAATYLGVAVSFSQEAVEARLLREWDTRVGRLGEANPALEFPILPPTFSGLSTPVIRPQHGPPVLQQHRDETGAVRSASSGRLRVLAVATEWSSGQGGLSTFNRQLCCALSTAGVDVTCIAIAPSREEVAQAGMMGVHLVAARATPSVDQREWLARRPAGLEEYRPDFIIGHGRVTGPAALRLADDVFPGSRRLHFVHMAPDEIEWHKLDREQPAGLRAEDRTQQELDLGRGADRVIAVGPRLQERYARELYSYGAPPPVRFDPGFDAAEESVSSPPLGKPWKILLLGRAEDHELKGLDLAARAIGRVTHRRDKTLPGIEFVVRGAKPEDVDLLRCSLRTWAASPRLDVTVRSYTAIETTLQRDMRSASLVLMPSRREGFGLVGVEAIASGIPVLITSASGLAEMLTEILSPVEAARIIVETSGDTNYSDMDVEEWERSIYASLYDREAAFRAAADLRNKLRLRYSWKGSVEGLLSALTPP